ncbi:hypothetical protein, partial [Cronobacter sakazakii]|uniref:hypothetical protein n=1 Tax=Cronobacter sakazakii TaxID=28141 RepID=UPI001F50B28C
MNKVIIFAHRITLCILWISLFRKVWHKREKPAVARVIAVDNLYNRGDLERETRLELATPTLARS